MRLLPLILLSTAILAGTPYDFFPDRPGKWQTDDEDIWVNKQISSIYLSPTDQREHWGIDVAPWDMVELIDTHCPDRRCNVNITVPSAVLIRDNERPVMTNVTLRFSGYFENAGFKGTKRDFIEVIKLLLRVTYNPLQTEFLNYADVSTKNISEAGYRAVYTGPKVIYARINNDNDDHLVMPYVTILVDSGASRPLPRPSGFCADFTTRRTALLDAMSHKFGKELVIYRMGCIMPKKDDSTFVHQKEDAKDDLACKKNTNASCRAAV
ncbi:hypothetical protein NOR_01013 [Metarhizium rileyi]|uniref:Uncharacterized protein n=1 Tax=Metarhizium rileyi (strain RCEF 4871) TaxID=1649241 RepID=A0A167JPA8_METRR|nr:hypothetical protein NOR_01013 [Metarhizium rileyi RCEF 4871]